MKKWGDHITAEERARGDGCQKGNAGCLCRVGWPLEEQCPDCRGDEGNLRDSYCVCGMDGGFYNPNPPRGPHALS